MQNVAILRRQCEIQSRKQNVGELPNVNIIADVSSENASSEPLLLGVAQQLYSHLAVHQHFIFDQVVHRKREEMRETAKLIQQFVTANLIKISRRSNVSFRYNIS